MFTASHIQKHTSSPMLHFLTGSRWNWWCLQESKKSMYSAQGNSVPTTSGLELEKNASRFPKTAEALSLNTAANKPSISTGGTIGSLPAGNHNGTDNPNSMVPLTPSTFLSCPHSFGGALTASSLITSISRQKHKISALAKAGLAVGLDSRGSCKHSHAHALGSMESVVGSELSSHKCFQPLSVTQQAQVDTSQSMQQLSMAFQNFYQEYTSDHHRNLPATHASGITVNESKTTCATAQALANLSLSPEDMIDITEYMQDEKNKKAVLYFLAFPAPIHLSWVQRQLKEICGHNSNHPLNDINTWTCFLPAFCF